MAALSLCCHIVSFVRIVGETKQLLSPVGGEENVFVELAVEISDDGIPMDICVIDLVVLEVQAVANPADTATLVEKREETYAIHQWIQILDKFQDFAYLVNGGSNVSIFYESLAHRALLLVWKLHHHVDVARGLVWIALAPEVMITIHVAVITRPDDEELLQDAPFAQGVQYLPNAFIDQLNIC